MTTFTIDNDSNITAFAALEDALNHGIGSTVGAFSTEKELTKLSAAWPIARFADVWNGFAGVVPFDSLKPVKKFTDRKAAIARIWKAIQALTPAPAQHAAPSAQHLAKDTPKKARATRQATAKDGATGAKSARTGSKTAQVVAMLQRKNGANLAEIMDKMGWQKHTVRGFMAGAMKKAGYAVESFKPDGGERTYRINS